MRSRCGSGNTLYFVSDRGPEQRNNIWAEDLSSGAVRQVTKFSDFDITYPSMGPDAIVFQKGGRLFLVNLPGENVTELHIRVVTDETTLRPRPAKADQLVASPSMSPTGKRAAFEARGDVVTLPAERGAFVNVTRTSGVAERYPRWSPDGKTLACWSDRSGEYQLTLRPADGAGAERKVTSLGPGFRYPPQWAPDSKKIAFIDQAMRIRIYDDGNGKVTQVDKSPDWISHPQLETFAFSWSPDSRWLAYARPAATSNSAVFLFDTRDGKLHQATSGYLNDTQPVFDPEGKYLFYASDRAFDPVYGTFDNTWTYANPTQLVAVALRGDVQSPLAARNDAENPAVDTNPPDEKAKKVRREAGGEAGRARATSISTSNGLEERGVVLPPKSGAYADLQAVKGKLLYRRTPRAGVHEEKSPMVYFDLDEREEKTILEDAETFEVTFDGKKMLVESGQKYAIVDVKEKQKFEKPMDAGRHRGAGRSARRMAADVHRCVPVRARLLLRSGHARRDWNAHEGALPGAAGRRGVALGRQLDPRRAPWRAELLAHVPRRRRCREGAERDRSECSASTGSSSNGAYRDQADRQGRAVGQRRCVRRSTNRA